MATSDRLYELCLECKEHETAVDKLSRDVERLEAVRRAAGELADAVEEARGEMGREVADALHGLRQLE